MSIAKIVVVGASLLACGTATSANKAPPDISGVWAVFQAVTTSGKSAMADPPMSKQGQDIVNKFRGQFDLAGMAPNEHCVEPGMPTDMYGIGNQPIEIVQQPQRITILSEVGMQWRRIFLDGRAAPKGFPTTRNGHSVGHWEGDTLVVETTLLKEWLMPRWAHTENARIVEHFSLMKSADVTMARRGSYDNPGKLGEYVLVDELTMYDPALYDTPGSAAVYYRRLRDDEFFDNQCPEGLWWDMMEKHRK